MAGTKPSPKAEETALRIMDAALELFRKEGFDAATMRDIAKHAGVATGAAYYYYPSKEAIVLDFYRQSCTRMQSKIEAAARHAGLERRLRDLIGVKLETFRENRGVLRALLRNGADPRHPLSPFSGETREIREMDIQWFAQILEDCGIKIPRDLAPDMPGILWFFQMGVIFFWVIDESEGQARTQRLLELAVKSVVTLIRLASLPLMRPVRKSALELVALVKGAV